MVQDRKQDWFCIDNAIIDAIPDIGTDAFAIYCFLMRYRGDPLDEFTISTASSFLSIPIQRIRESIADLVNRGIRSPLFSMLYFQNLILNQVKVDFLYLVPVSTKLNFHLDANSH